MKRWPDELPSLPGEDDCCRHDAADCQIHIGQNVIPEKREGWTPSDAQAKLTKVLKTGLRSGTRMTEPKGKRGFMDEDRLDSSERRLVAHCIKRWGVPRNQLDAATARLMIEDFAAELGGRR